MLSPSSSEQSPIRDVLSHYTPVESFFNLEKKVADDPEFDKQRALKKLHAHVEAHPDAIERKARVMVDHFLGSVIARRKVGGQARAMVVTQSRQRARDYFRAISECLAELKSPYKAIVAFSTDEKKPGTAKEAFQRYYKTTLLAEETDPDRLHTLKADLDAAQVYAWPQLEDFVARYLAGEERENLDPIIDDCRDAYVALPQDQQIGFKGDSKSFVRTYGFLGCILPYSVPEWEKLFIFLQFVIPKLPAPADDDLSQGVLETVDMESYRPEMRATVSLKMKNEDGEVGPLPTGGGGGSRQPEMDRLSNILKEFNEEFGNIEWKDADKIKRVISVEIPERVAADQAYRNAMQFSDKQNARIEHDKALQRAILGMLTDQTELFKQFSDNAGFKQWLSERVFDLTYQPRTGQRSAPGAWRERALGAVTTHFGPAAKWRGIGDGLADYFEDHAGEAIMLSGIELLAGKLQVAFEDVLTVLQVLAADDIRVLERTYTKSEGSAEESREVADGELRSGLASLYARGEIAAQGEQFAASVLVGWKPAGNGGEEART